MRDFFDWLKGRILWLLYAGCAVSLVLEVAFRFLGHSYDHLHFGYEEVFGFHAGWGFITFALLVAAAHALGALSRREESYYEERSKDPGPSAESADA